MARILLVDDDPQLLNMMSLAFRKHGHDITPASDGRKAFAAMNGNGFDVVITDISMPNCDGIELINKIAPMTMRPAVIATSGGSQMIEEKLLLEMAKVMKADLVIPKPATPRQFLAAVETLLKKRSSSANPAEESNQAHPNGESGDSATP